MKLFAALLFAAAANEAKGANTCLDGSPNPALFENLGKGQLVQLDGSLYTTKTTISGDCIAGLAASGAVYGDGAGPVYKHDAAGCRAACLTDETNPNFAPDSCDAANHIGSYDLILVGMSWNDETKTCTCYAETDPDPTGEWQFKIFPAASAYPRTECGDRDYGCTYCINCLLDNVCSAEGDIESDLGFTGEIALENYNCDVDLNLVEEGIEYELKLQFCSYPLGDFQCECDATVTELTAKGCDGGATSGTLDVKFSVDAIARLQNTDNGFTERTADTLWRYQAWAPDGGLEWQFALSSDEDRQRGFASAVEDYVNTRLHSGYTSILCFSCTQSNPVTSFDISDITSKLLDESKNWYPTWHDGGDKHTCKNDGNYPMYMGLTQTFFRSSLEDCCNQYYSWMFNLCMMDGGADPEDYITGEFYVDFESGSCKQSCLKDTCGASEMNCGGLAESWQQTYEDAESCCEERLFWANQKACVAESNGVKLAEADLGSDTYYVDWSEMKCVRDCAKKSGNPGDCGGLANHWDEKYDSKSECCSTRLPWVDSDDCNE